MKRFILIAAVIILILVSILFAYILHDVNSPETTKELQQEVDDIMRQQQEELEAFLKEDAESSEDETDELPYTDAAADAATEILLSGGWLPEDGTLWVDEYTGEYTVESADTEEGMVSLLFREDKSLAQKDILRGDVIISEMYDTNGVLRRKESMFSSGSIEQINYNERGEMLEYRLGDFESDEHICYHADGTLISKQISDSQTFESFTYYANNVTQYHYFQSPYRMLHEFYDKSGRLTDVHLTEGNTSTKTRYNQDGSYESEITYEDNTVWKEIFDSAGNCTSRLQIN